MAKRGRSERMLKQLQDHNTATTGHYWSQGGLARATRAAHRSQEYLPLMRFLEPELAAMAPVDALSSSDHHLQVGSGIHSAELLLSDGITSLGTHSTPETPHPVVSSPLESLEGDATSSSIPVQQPVASWKTRLAPPSLLSMPLHTQHSALVPPTLAPESVGNNSGDSNTCPSAAPTHDMAQEAGVATGGSGCMHSEPQADSVSRVMKRGSTPSPTSVQVSYDAVMARSGQHLTDFDVLFGHGLFSPHSTAPTTHTAHRVAAGTATTTATATGTGAATGAGTGTGMCGITASGSSSNLNLEGLECGICLAPLLDEDDEDPDGLGSRGGGEQFVAPGAPTSTLLAMPCCHCLVHLACISRCLELRAIRKCCCVCQRHFTTELTEAVADQEASQRSAAKRARGRLLSGVGELGVHSVFQPRRASRRASSVPKHAK